MFFCVLAAGTVFLRAEMLRERLDPKKAAVAAGAARPTYAGNYAMIISYDLAGIGFVGMLISFHLRGNEPSPELLFLLGTCALSSAVALVSMIGHNWREFLRCLDADHAAEVERSLPEALEAGVHAFMHRDVVYEPQPPHVVPHEKKVSRH
jgi:hypothetical protein